MVVKTLGGGNSIFLNTIFTPIPGEMIQFGEHFFQMGWKPPTRKNLKLFLTDIIKLHLLRCFTIPNDPKGGCLDVLQQKSRWSSDVFLLTQVAQVDGYLRGSFRS